MLVAASVAAEPRTVPDLPSLSTVEQQVRVVIRMAHRRLAEKPDVPQRWGHYASVLGVHEFLAESVLAYETAERLDPDDFRWPYLAAVRLEQEDPEGSQGV